MHFASWVGEKQLLHARWRALFEPCLRNLGGTCTLHSDHSGLLFSCFWPVSLRINGQTMVQSYCLKAKHLACSTLQSTAPQYTRTSLGKIQHSSRDSQLSTFSTECKLRLVGTKLSPCWLRPWQPSVFHRFQRCSPSLGLEQTLKMPHTFSNIHQPAQYDIFARWLQHGAPFLDLLVAGKELQC